MQCHHRSHRQGARNRPSPPAEASLYESPMLTTTLQFSTRPPTWSTWQRTIHRALPAAQVSASDPDLGPNGHVSYSIVASDLGHALSSYVSVGSQSGVVFAQPSTTSSCALPRAGAAGPATTSPALSANVSLRVLVGDRNDTRPEGAVPDAQGPAARRSSTRCPAHAARLPGHQGGGGGRRLWTQAPGCPTTCCRPASPDCSAWGCAPGEVRTARALGDRDAARQRLLVAVRDGGQPPPLGHPPRCSWFSPQPAEALPGLPWPARAV